ncbi:hypothetical protein K2173_001536 [Erythroxylum novogranatense]|uniref:GDSL esterase/lipase n=1 Tax=Erythroxylum novogranatense TaxID=1862640 RepID=A0AAV8T583_9ROSI|nr:hypothetical protein K2173_001536 [Erythroxylum novogranatense]
MGNCLNCVLSVLKLLFWIANSDAQGLTRAVNNSVTAILVFGDSTVDTGNNNYWPTLLAKANFMPYGRDFPTHSATGRFSNGRLATDFLASYIGLKENVPPYLDPNLSIEDLKTGVSFASAGSGFDPDTPKITNVIPIPKQLEYFIEYKKRMVSAIGEQETEHRISKAVFLVSAGTNDFVLNYYNSPPRQLTFSITAYEHFVLELAINFLQDLVDQGARKVIFTGLSPIGCLPAVITQKSSSLQRHCIDHISKAARDFNHLIEKELNNLQERLASTNGAKFYITDTYGPLDNMIHGAGSAAFDDVNKGCCGYLGTCAVGPVCNKYVPVCQDASKYVFWDAVHPTEIAYYKVFKSIQPTIDRILRE